MIAYGIFHTFHYALYFALGIECLVTDVEQHIFAKFGYTFALKLTYLSAFLIRELVAIFIELFIHFLKSVFGFEPVVNVVVAAVDGYVVAKAAKVVDGGLLAVAARESHTCH